MLLQFVATLLSTSVFVSSLSLLWPRVTTKPSPPQLEKVREVVLQTQIGKTADDFFSQINVSSIAGSLTKQAGDAVTQKVSQEVTNRAVSQIISQIDTLPLAQKKILEEAICKRNE